MKESKMFSCGGKKAFRGNSGFLILFMVKLFKASIQE